MSCDTVAVCPPRAALCSAISPRSAGSRECTLAPCSSAAWTLSVSPCAAARHSSASADSWDASSERLSSINAAEPGVAGETTPEDGVDTRVGVTAQRFSALAYSRSANPAPLATSSSSSTDIMATISAPSSSARSRCCDALPPALLPFACGVVFARAGDTSSLDSPVSSELDASGCDSPTADAGPASPSHCPASFSGTVSAAPTPYLFRASGGAEDGPCVAAGAAGRAPPCRLLLGLADGPSCAAATPLPGD